MTRSKPQLYSQMRLLRIGIGRRIYEERVKKVMSLEQLAMQAGLKQEKLDRIELGRRKADLDIIAKIARGLGVPLSALIRPGEGV